MKNHPDCDIVRVDALHIRALHLPPVRCMMAQGSCAVSGVITVTNNYCFSALYASNIRVTNKNNAAGTNLHLVHNRLYVPTLSPLGPGFCINA